jgi:tRNA1(Val) A37 N6-methylase TrmN6
MTEVAGTSDAFLGGRLRLVQSAGGHRAGVDAVMLAAAVKVAPGDRVLDAGAGSGVVGLCVAARVPGCTVTGVEIDPALARLAKANAEANGLGSRYRAICADLTAPLASLSGRGLAPESFDAAAANPPFYSAGQVTASPDAGRAQAAIMPPGDLSHWLRFLTAMTKPGGLVILVYPVAGLAEVLAAFEKRCGAIMVFPLFPRAGGHAHRIIVAGTKGSRAPLNLRSGVVLHGDGQAYTAAAEAVLRHGAALDIGL